MQTQDIDTEELTKELFYEHQALIEDDPILFRKRVVRFLRQKTGWERNDAVQEYERVLKWFKKNKPEFVEPLFEAVEAKKKMKKNNEKLQPDNDCFSVIEVMGQNIVGRCQSFLTLEDAKKKYDSKVQLWPKSKWVLLGGLGPNSAENYRLAPGEREFEVFTPKSD